MFHFSPFLPKTILVVNICLQLQTLFTVVVCSWFIRQVWFAGWGSVKEKINTHVSHIDSRESRVESFSLGSASQLFPPQTVCQSLRAIPSERISDVNFVASHARHIRTEHASESLCSRNIFSACWMYEGLSITFPYGSTESKIFL